MGRGRRGSCVEPSEHPRPRDLGKAQAELPKHRAVRANRVDFQRLRLAIYPVL
jgi:hypothetical protein